jgi:anti-sigma B factor antagonist
MEAGSSDPASWLTMSKLTIEQRQMDGVTVLVLSGEMLLDDGDLEFRRVVHDLIERGRVNIVVDLDGITHIDSSGVGMMVAKLQTARRQGGDIKLVHLTGRSQRLLSTMKIMTIFETFDDVPSAVRSYG